MDAYRFPVLPYFQIKSKIFFVSFPFNHTKKRYFYFQTLKSANLIYFLASSTQTLQGHLSHAAFEQDIHPNLAMLGISCTMQASGNVLSLDSIHVYGIKNAGIKPAAFQIFVYYAPLCSCKTDLVRLIAIL